MSENKSVANKKLIFPHTYAFLFSILLVAWIATYFITPGEFQRETNKETGQTTVIEGTYRIIDSNPTHLFEVFKAIPLGMENAANIIFYIFIVGGVFGIIRATGVIEAAIDQLMVRMEGRERLLVPGFMFLFSIGGFSFGMAEETIIFVPIGIAVARAAGFDAVTGTAMVTLGAASGFIGGMLNPFTIGVAQEIAEVPLFSGFAFRLSVYVVILLFAMWYVARYAFKVKEKPSHSVIFDIEKKSANSTSIPPISDRHYLVISVVGTGLVINIYGVMKWEWFLTELTASFIIMGVAAGVVGRLSFYKTFDSFVEGAKAMTFGALMVGFARAIVIVLEEGHIIDTLIYSVAHLIEGLPQTYTAICMFLAQSFLSFFIPAGPAQAATTMPVMVPVSDLTGVSRQVAVLAFQYGDAITNSIIPTSSVLMGYLAVAGIPYERWVRFVWKLILGWMVIAVVALIIAVLIGLR
ncbi:C4-dicarboxylate ABC transporter [Siminovitchia terrae]|uniref:C4-dicarboxylate ABC transporter n=1 Tax=Siminovitchia terrae TaxID=1914933 RepID=A0ABQ4L3Y4_SIMTE|nr:TIGR00366 family protein [Siminovitchia terrae]GIN98712.1 C4-dicarboxylate ABC transporter [Siminovitchia terrae]